MPELPDLQVFARNLKKKLGGKKLHTLVLNTDKINTGPEAIVQAVHNHELTDVYRHGKELYFKFGHNTLAMHLMLRGQLHLLEGANTQKYTICELQFEDGTTLVLTDPQKAAKLALDPEDKEAPDALAETVTAHWLKEELSGTRKAIKDVLLDQKIIGGIGNAYADEILYDAGISPFSASNKIPEEKVEALSKSIRKVLTDAEKEILKAEPDIISGEVRDFLKVHTRKKATPKGEPILVKEGSRKTYYTESQELFK
ncbi:Fpg/Nei family DNA glycosylase [Mucilaginibacter sp. RS28]|uniref:Fpg/Nei family DNA glycosylase n=1 Tax=Mucilaginibacter straminoryzae TaxID=2932774 RepID=A0A9X1X2A4_9SPHI|nr:DNA-formamidopyrimidine glycosylase family protein [Mucilaginibacter straminoryzae]MCJ8209316.1 Fpg/Nei family DNA glycosylase [Mucilaginibacter straminoryzae]